MKPQKTITSAIPQKPAEQFIRISVLERNTPQSPSEFMDIYLPHIPRTGDFLEYTWKGRERIAKALAVTVTKGGLLVHALRVDTDSLGETFLQMVMGEAERAYAASQIPIEPITDEEVNTLIQAVGTAEETR